MKYLILVVFTSLCQIAEAQSSLPGGLYNINSKTRGAYVQVDGELATVFILGGMLDVAGTGSIITYMDSLSLKDSGFQSFTGGKSFIEYRDGKFFLTVHEIKSKSQTFQLHPVPNPAKARIEINNGYWWKQFLDLDKKLEKDYPFYGFNWRSGFTRWEKFSQKELPFEEFKRYADSQLQVIADSIRTTELDDTKTLVSITKEISTVDLTTVKAAMQRFPVSYERRYFYALIDEICNNRPDLFFPLAGALPDKKIDMFDYAYRNKKHRQVLRKQPVTVEKVQFFARKKG